MKELLNRIKSEVISPLFVINYIVCERASFEWRDFQEHKRSLRKFLESFNKTQMEQLPSVVQEQLKPVLRQVRRLLNRPFSYADIVHLVRSEPFDAYDLLESINNELDGLGFLDDKINTGGPTKQSEANTTENCNLQESDGRENKDDSLAAMTTEDKMKILLDDIREDFEPEVRGWSAVKFGEEIEASSSAVKKTNAWRELQDWRAGNKKTISSVKLSDI